MKLPRPYIPLSVRERVIDEQMAEAKLQPTWAARTAKSISKRVRFKLEEFFGNRPVELHHRPALVNRQRDGDDYIPRANDPDYLIYLPADDHDIETRVRGQHGQYSDLAMARKRKRRERKAARPKRRWPTRKFPARLKRLSKRKRRWR